MPNKKKKCAECGVREARQGRNTCNCCRKRKQRSNDPVKAAFCSLRDSAMKRGIQFTLTDEWFAAMCANTEYHLKVGGRPGDLSMDRIDSSKGYTPDNCRVVPRSYNTIKGNIERIANPHVRKARLEQLERSLNPIEDKGRPDPNEVW